jgi:hypothetical protein
MASLYQDSPLTVDSLSDSQHSADLSQIIPQLLLLMRL